MNRATVVSTVRNKIGGETSIVALTMFGQNALRVVGSMIMTRLLTSEAFGVIGVITSVIVVFGLVSDIGISAFIIRYRGNNNADYINELWTLKLIRSIVLNVAVIAFSGPIARYLDKPDLQWGIIVTAFTFTIDGFDSLGALLALRGRQIKRLSQLDIVTQAFNLSMTLTMAFIFRSYWGIIIGNTIGQLMRVWLSYYMFPGIRHRWRFRRERAKELWQFSKFITGSTILSLIILQADKVVLAKVFPLHVFGLYILSAGLAAVPAGVASGYCGRILLPRYAEIARNAPALLANAYYRERLIVHIGYAAAIGVLAGCAPTIIHILYDPRYADAVFYFQVLLLGAFFSFGTLAANEVMIALGKSHFTLTTNIVRVTFFAIGGYAAFVRYGPIGLIWVVSLLELVAQIYGWIVLRHFRLLNIGKEALILLGGIGGLGIGYVVNIGAQWALIAIGIVR